VTSDCPYCARPLVKTPKRKTVCPSCGEAISVRNGVPVTGESAAKIDGLANLDRLDVTSSMFDQVESELAQSFGHHPQVKDVLWGILNRLVVLRANQDDLSEVYREMADQLRREGKDSRPQLRQALELELKTIASDRSVKRVSIIGVGDDRQCPGCASLNGKECDLAEAIRDLPVPAQCTSEEGCRCGYSPVFGEYGFSEDEIREWGTLAEDD